MAYPNVLFYDAFELLKNSATVSGHQLALEIQAYHGPHGEETCIFGRHAIQLCELHHDALTEYLATSSE